MIRRRQPASLRARALAATIDGILLTCLSGWGLFAAIRIAAGEDLADYDERRHGRRIKRRMRALSYGLVAVRVPLRNVFSPGQRVAGIGRVDAATGGPVTLRSALALQLCELAWRRLAQIAVRPATRRRDADDEQVRRLRDAHPADPDAWKAAIDVLGAPPAGCGRTALTSLVLGSIIPLTSLLSPTGQTVADRLTGTILITTR